jgi:predicted peroxiredoxin
MKEKTKMARNLYEQLKQQAKEVEDKENSKLYVSETVTKKTREKVKEIVRKAVEMIICDEELGLITEDEASEEITIEKLIYKSL